MKKQTVAAFDFDGTLTYRDSFFTFLIHTFGLWGFCCRVLPILPQLILYVLGKATRTDAKEALLGRFFNGMHIDKLRELGEVFAQEKLPSQFRPEALERLHWHQKQGHRCLIVSASVDVWLEPWARENGIEKVLSSRLLVDENQRVSGRLLGENCRRAEKVRRLEEELGPLDQYELYAYGDTEGDKEMLEAADHPYYRKFI